MASLTFDSFWAGLGNDTINVSTDTFYIMLVTSSYTPNKGTHAKRSDVTNEVSGTGYTAGGQVCTCTAANDTSLHKETFTFATAPWAGATITARGAVIYKHRGGLASADELVAYQDFGADVTSTAAAFTDTFSAPITIQN